MKQQNNEIIDEKYDDGSVVGFIDEDVNKQKQNELKENQINQQTQQIMQQSNQTGINNKEFAEIADSLKKIQTDILNRINLALSENSNNLSNTEKGIFKDLIDLFTKYFKTIQSLNRYLTNPPSDEEFKALNTSLNLRKIEKDFRAIKQAFDDLKIEKCSAEFSNKFKNFMENVEGNLSNASQTYEKFLNNFIEKEKNIINDFSNNIQNFKADSNEVLKIFSNSFDKAYKKVKGGFYGLMILNIILAFFLGFISFTIISKKKELDEMTEIFNNISGISIKENNGIIEFIFDKNQTKIIENKTQTKIILKEITNGK